jgi:hypothetical protein
MYGLPVDIDLDFLRGKELLQVCVGFNDLILNFEGNVAFSITSQCRYECNGKSIDIDNYPSSASLICSMLGKKIIDANSIESKHLRLKLDNECHFIIYDDNEHYESYLIKGSPNGDIIV